MPRNVDHAVVGRDDRAGAGGERSGEDARRGIHPLQRRHPLVGLPAALVADRVEVGRVHVDERTRMPRGEVGGDPGALCDVLGRDELGAAAWSRR